MEDLTALQELGFSEKNAYRIYKMSAACAIANYGKWDGIDDLFGKLPNDLSDLIKIAGRELASAVCAWRSANPKEATPPTSP